MNHFERKNKDLRYRYGIGLREYSNMIVDQHSKCPICGNSIDFSNGHVDHCHNTQEVRGVLCPKCNKGIGYLDDNVNNLKQAIKYLDG